jgi:hypothetical protein
MPNNNAPERWPTRDIDQRFLVTPGTNPNTPSRRNTAPRASAALCTALRPVLADPFGLSRSDMSLLPTAIEPGARPVKLKGPSTS